MTTTTQSLRPAITNATGKLLSVYLDTDQSNAANLNKGHERALAAKLKAISEGLAVKKVSRQRRRSLATGQRSLAAGAARR